MAAGDIIQGVRWLRDAAGRLVGYRNPITDKDEEYNFAAGQSLVSADWKSSLALTAASYAQRAAQGWTRLTLPAGVTSADAAVRVVAGRYEFRGRLSGTLTTGMTVASLPAALPAGNTADAACVTSTAVTPLSLTNTGALVLGTVTASPTWVSLDGMSAALPAAPASTYVGHSGLLPVMRINTAGGVALPAPALDTYVSATIEISPELSGFDGLSLRAVEVSGHGNSTFLAPKKPMKIRFPSGAGTSVMGMPAGRHWRALANYYDETLMRNAWAFELMRRVYQPWTPRSVSCEVYLNGEYQGVYQMTESVRADASRLPVSLPSSSATGLDATGAFMMEINQRYVAEGEPGFDTVPSGVKIQFDDPSPPSASQITYITGWMNNFDATLMGAGWLDPVTGYAQYVDMASFADWWLVSELTRNQDSVFFTSCKLYKERDTATAPGRLRMGPLWDSDLSLGNGYNNPAAQIRDWQGEAEGWHTRAAVWINRMMQDPAFVAVAKARWALFDAALRGPDGVLAWGDKMAALQAGAARMDAIRWGLSGDAGPRWEAVGRWLRRRLGWIGSRVPAITVFNLSINPRPVNALTKYALFAGTGGAASLTQAAGNPLGGPAARATWTATPSSVAGVHHTVDAVPGRQYTGYVWVRCSKNQNVVLRCERRISEGGATVGTVLIGPLTALQANTMVALPALTCGAVEATATVTRWYVANTGGSWAINDWLEICGVIVVEGIGPNQLVYADPETSVRWTWDGTAFASTSRGWPL